MDNAYGTSMLIVPALFFLFIQCLLIKKVLAVALHFSAGMK